MVATQRQDVAVGTASARPHPQNPGHRVVSRSVCVKLIAASVLFGMVPASTLASADVSIRKEEVLFKQGETGATIKGKISGDQTVDYRVRAGAGQSLMVAFTPDNSSAYFNVIAPGADSALFIGSTSGNRFESTLPASGTYTIRVYLMRNAARRGESVNYTLQVGVAADASKLTADIAGPDKWDASGSVKCSAGAPGLDRECGFRVVRTLSKRSADVWIANIAKGQSGYRFFHYADRQFTTSDNAKLAWQRKDDNWWISVDGREFYLIPDALIHGG